MAIHKEELLEALVDLERTKEKERESRFESEVLLKGLHAITTANSAAEMFASVLRVLRDTLSFDDAFILVCGKTSPTLKVIAATDSLYEDTTWLPHSMLRRVLSGLPVAVFDIGKVPEWNDQPASVKTRVKSALHAPFYTPNEVAVLVCVSARPAFFNKRHIHLFERFSPLASQALINLDARELHVKQHMLEKARYRLESIIATIPVGLLVFQNKRIRIINETFRKMFASQATLDTPIDAVLADIGIPSNIIQQVLKKKTFTNLECRLSATEIDSQSLHLSLTGIASESEEHERLLVIEDISARKLAEETLRYSAFQSGVAEMATSILHNIGNSITSIVNRARRLQEGTQELLDVADVLKKTHAQTMLEKSSDTEKLPEIIKTASEVIHNVVSNEIRSNAQLISDGVKHFSEIITIHQGAAKPERMATSFSLRRLLEEAVTMQGDMLEKYNVSVTIDVDDSLQEVILPRNQVLQAIINLIKNSHEAIQECSCAITKGKQIHIHARPIADNRFVINVLDNGCGMDPHYLDNLFNYGYSSKGRGSGYGLHWVANLVQSLGGAIHAHSAGKDKGMDIHIELPIWAKTITRASFKTQTQKILQ